jgi:hypothetical protein
MDQRDHPAPDRGSHPASRLTGLRYLAVGPDSGGASARRPARGAPVCALTLQIRCRSPNRKMILAHLFQNLKSGGWLVVEDAVFHEPALTGPRLYRSAMVAFAERKHGTDYLLGQTLPMEMSALGLHQVSAQQVQDLFDSDSELALFFASLLLQERTLAPMTQRAQPRRKP